MAVTKPNVNTIWASGGVAIPVPQAKQAQGWVAEVPEYDLFNGMVQQLSQFQAHTNLNGVPNWDSVTAYETGSIVKSPVDNLVYQAAANNTNQPPVTSVGGAINANWGLVSTGRLLGVRVFTSNATYTPTPGTRSVVIEAQGGGGGGGGAPATGAATCAVSGCGGSGSYAKGRFTTGFSGASIVVGAAGAGGAAGSNPGGAGGSSSVGAIISAPGGTPGQSTTATAPPVTRGGSTTAAAPSGGNIESTVGAAGGGCSAITGPIGLYTPGANSKFSAGGVAQLPVGGPGAGGSGVVNLFSTAAQAGLPGGPGVVIIWEFN